MEERKIYENERLKRALASPTLPNMDLQDPQGIVYACRFNQSDEIHDDLRRLLFSDQGMASIIAHPSRLFDNHGTDTSATSVASINDTFRIATFIVSTGATGEITNIDLTNVHISPGFRMIDFDPLQVVQNGTAENQIIAVLIQSLRKIMTLISQPNQRLMISFDTYFNRPQAAAGSWHQDADYNSAMPRLDPQAVTLEYFCENRMLGPELMLLDQDQPILPGFAAVNAAVAQNFHHSCRFIVGDKSVAFFINTRVIHATPMISNLQQNPLTGEFEQINPAFLPPDRRVMALDPGRAENIHSGFNALAANTLLQRRSFLRSHVVSLTDAQYGQLQQETAQQTRYMEPLFIQPILAYQVDTSPFPEGTPVTRPVFEVHSRAPPIQGQSAAEPPASAAALNPMESPFFGGAPPLRNFFIQSKHLYINEYVPLTPLNQKQIKWFQEKEEIFIANFETISNELDIKKIDGGKTRKSKNKYKSQKRRLHRKKSRKRNKN